MVRKVLHGFVMVASLVAGFWFGGELTRTPSMLTIAAVAGCVLLADLLSPSERWQGRIGSALLAGLCFAGGWYLAGREIDTAYADCSHRGEEVRQALSSYRDSHGGYPVSLAELPGLELPGRRLLRPGLMQYSRTADGYVLAFADTLVRNTATEQRPFFSRSAEQSPGPPAAPR